MTQFEYLISTHVVVNIFPKFYSSNIYPSPHLFLFLTFISPQHLQYSLTRLLSKLKGFSFFLFVIENIFMFCIFNPYTLPTAYKLNLPSHDVQKLYLYLGMALSKSVSVFKERKNNEQLQPTVSQKSCSSTKITQSEEKLQKNVTEISPIALEEKKSAQQLKELQTKKTEEAIQTNKLARKKQSFLSKRRIIRKAKTIKQKQEIKRVEKTLKVSIVQKIDFTSFTATLPHLRVLRSKEIIAKIEDFEKRSVKQWIIVDPAAERRKRFLKHLL